MGSTARRVFPFPVVALYAVSTFISFFCLASVQFLSNNYNNTTYINKYMCAWGEINAKYYCPLTQGELPAPPTFTPITSELGRTL